MVTDNKENNLNNETSLEDEAQEVEVEVDLNSPPAEEKDWQAEAGKNLELYLRSQADMVNMKKRLDREKADFVKYANDSLIRDLLPVVDNMERALGHASSANGTDSSGLLEGLRLTYEGFMAVLEKNGVKPVSTAGEKFDPNFHEAIMQREDPDAEDNMVLQEVQKGYLLNERLVRPAMVVVSKKPAAERESE